MSQAQDLYELNPTKSSVLIEGSSSLHDWEMEAKELAGNFDLNEDKYLETLIFESTVSGLVSDKSKMTKLAQKALKVREYSKITFKSSSPVLINEVEIKLSGFLSVSGVTKEIELSLRPETDDNGIKLEGSYSLKMTDYGVDPPKALLGAIKTDNEVIINFSLFFES
jgi:polyisoprenoid-binding protein YceI